MPAEAQDKKGIAGAIQGILEQGQQVRERISKAVTDTLGSDKFSARGLGETAKKVMSKTFETISRQVSNTVPKDQESVLRDVVYGIGDAFGVAAQAAAKAMDEARNHGRAFAGEDIKRMTVELGDLASTFVDAVAKTGSSAIEHGSALAKSATEMANGAAQEMKPHVEDALRAAALHPVDLAVDTVKAGAGASMQVAGSLFTTLGDLMHKAADLVQSAGRPAGNPAGVGDDDEPGPDSP